MKQLTTNTILIIRLFKFRYKQKTQYLFGYRHNRPYNIIMFRVFKIRPRYKTEQDIKDATEYSLPPGIIWSERSNFHDMYYAPLYYLISHLLFGLRSVKEFYSWLLKASIDLANDN